MYPGAGRGRMLSLLVLMAAFALAAGCTGMPAPPPPQSGDAQHPAGEAWNDTVLSDLNGRGNFSISNFSGRTVIVPVVSVSCAACIPQLIRQVAEAGDVARADNGSVEVVVLDLDPADGPGFLSAYGGGRTFTGWSAHAPPAMTGQIFRRFGPFAVDTETVPVILVCPGGHDLLLPPGLKDAGALSGAIAKEC